MKHIGLFEGIGGFSLAARWMGWQTIAWCEINPFCQTILKYHFKEATPHEDITKTDFTIYRGKCDILTGGFPCQPYSVAGKQLGKEDERHLWPQMLRAIREIQPRWVVGENVRGLVSWNGGMVFHEVQADLEAEGYEVLPFLLPACAVNAPHRRDRIWFVAYHTGKGLERSAGQSIQGCFNGLASICNGGTTPHTGIKRCDNGSDNWQERYVQRNIGIAPKNKSEWNGRQFGLRKVGAVHEFEAVANSESIENKRRGQGGLYPEFAGVNAERVTTDTGGTGREKCNIANIATEQGHDTWFPIADWRNFPTQSPVCSRNDGVSYGLDGITFSKWRNESIKAYGNAIVPQVAYQIFKAIEAYELTHNQNH